MGSYIDPICYKKDDNIWIKIAMINDDFKIVAVDSCIVCKDYEPLIQLGDIKYKNINPKSPSKHMVLNLPNIEDTLYGYIVMYVEFDNIHSMKIIKINKIDYIYLSKLEDSSYHKTIFFNPIIFQPTNEETKFLEQFMDEMNKKIKEIQFYIPRRYRWYDYILPWKKEKYKRISKNEEILIYFININNKKVL
jgi:hypothetical protein